MSHTLIEVDEYTATVVVPDGLDPGSQRSEAMTAIAQSLANRTKNLNGRFDALAADAARKSQANTFATTQTINAPFVDSPILRTDSKAADHSAGNRWQFELEFPISGTSYVGLFVGQPPDGWVIAYNARWHPDTQRWRQLDAAQPSTALVSRLSVAGSTGVPELQVSYKAAGATPWINWPPDLGGNLYVGQHVYAAGEFSYQGGAHNHINWTVPLWGGAGDIKVEDDGTISCPNNLYAEFPLRIPAGVTISNLKCSFFQANPSQYGMVSLNRRGRQTTGIPSYEVFPADAKDSPTGVGWNDLDLLTAPHTLDAAYDYSVLVKPGNAADKVGRIFVDWQDPGPRNLG